MKGKCGMWNVEFGIWNLEFGIWNYEIPGELLIPILL